MCAITPPTCGYNSDHEASTVGLTFVEMMFAVAVGDAAAQVAKVMDQVQQSTDPLHSVWDVRAAVAHLFLVIIVIATSWVGWSHSSATREYMRGLTRIFSNHFPFVIAFPFWMLLIDVFLVVCYFVLSEGAEIPKYDSATNQFTIAASARPEITWLLVILFTYVIWNVSWNINRWCRGQSALFATARNWRIVSALVSLAIVICAFWFRFRVSDSTSVVKVDSALLLAVLLFRLRLVDESGKLVIWDIIRAFLLVVSAALLIYAAQ